MKEGVAMAFHFLASAVCFGGASAVLVALTVLVGVGLAGNYFVEGTAGVTRAGTATGLSLLALIL